MQEKGCLADTSELGKASFRVAPKALYAIDMATLIGKFIVSVVNPEMLLVPYIYQAVIATLRLLVRDEKNHLPPLGGRRFFSWLAQVLQDEGRRPGVVAVEMVGAGQGPDRGLFG